MADRRIVLVPSRDGKLKDRLEAVDAALGNPELHVFSRTAAKENILEEIRTQKPDLLITENLEGFEMHTLTDAIGYNLVHCRQIHLISREDIPEMEELKGQLSLVMHFFAGTERIAEKVREKNPDVPYLEVADLSVEGLAELVRKVMK